MRYITIEGEFIPKHCIYGPRPVEGVVLEKLEWGRITDHLYKEQKEKELAAALKAKEEAKKELSNGMTSTWSNTLARIKSLDNQKRLEIEEKEKQNRIDQYNAILKRREEESKEYCEKMRKILYEEGDAAKTINAAVLHSLVLDDRRRQIELQNLRKTAAEKEQELAEKFKNEAENFYKELAEEKKREKAKKMKQKEMLDLQMEDIRRRRAKDAEEFELAKQDVMRMILESEKIETCRVQEKKDKRRLAEDYLNVLARKQEFRKKLALEQEVEDEINDIYAKYEKIISKERRCREKRMKDEEVEQRTKISEKLGSKLMELKAKEVEFLSSSLKSAEKRAQKEEEERREKQRKALEDIMEGKRKAEERKARQRYVRKEMKKWEMIQQYKTAEVNEQWKEEERKRVKRDQELVRKGLDCQLKHKEARDDQDRKAWLRPIEDVIRERTDLENYCKEAEDFAKELNLPDYPIRAAIAKVKKIYINDQSPQKEEAAKADAKKQKSRAMASGCYCLKY